MVFDSWPIRRKYVELPKRSDAAPKTLVKTLRLWRSSVNPLCYRTEHEAARGALSAQNLLRPRRLLQRLLGMGLPPRWRQCGRPEVGWFSRSKEVRHRSVRGIALGRGNVGRRNSRTDQTYQQAGNQDYSSIRRGVRRCRKRSEAFHQLLECGRD